MTFKKMLLVVGMALAAIAFAAPASASALEWTDSEEEFFGERTDFLSGQITFGNPEAGQSKFGCNTNLWLSAEGEGTTGTLTEFSPLTNTCKGEGAFASCILKGDSVTNLWIAEVHIVGTNKLTVTNPFGTSVVLHYYYEGANCPIKESTFTISDFNMTLTFSGLNLPATVSGLVESHTTDVLGNETTQTVAIFGSVSGTGTLSVS